MFTTRSHSCQVGENALLDQLELQAEFELRAKFEPLQSTIIVMIIIFTITVIHRALFTIKKIHQLEKQGNEIRCLQFTEDILLQSNIIAIIIIFTIIAISVSSDILLPMTFELYPS